ncbi:MAG: hypothetical protein HZA03_09800 [Nitrospinae bacterium]|nr:hypothetical protein [Nitrospinota bacterium]
MAGFIFVIMVWLLGHTCYLMMQMKKSAAGENREDGEKGEIDDEHR